ncbi:MAG: Fe-S-cluster containining protein [Candidatus Binatia bacterium]|jgi:Fe-S-cluster containining protein
MKAHSPPNSEIIGKLCLKCGLCCDGSLFRDVELHPGDDADRLKEHGLRLRKISTPDADATPRYRFPQPCRALGADCRCSVYKDRPGHCRAFECLLFGDVAAGRLKLPSAQRIVSKARNLTETVRSLLDALGETDADAPLAARMRRVSRDILSGERSPDDFARFGDLTIVYSQLTDLLARRFYRPG